MANERVTIVGAGTMGRGIASVMAIAGKSVRLVDADTEASASALQRIQREVLHALDRGLQASDPLESVIGRISVGKDIEEACGDADWVIEAIVEDLDAKRSVFKTIDGCTPEEAILATNTSSLSVTAIAAATTRPERVLGLHFFNPPLRMDLIEIVRALTTDQVVVDQARAFVKSSGKEGILVRDSPGFATSRISALVGNEAFYMLQEGVASAEDIDRGIRLALNHPMGPLELGDLVGLDVRLGVLNYLHSTLGEKYRPCPLLVRYVEAGRLGRKTGQGVFRYDGDGRRMKE